MISPQVLLLARRCDFNLHVLETVLQHRRVPYLVVDPDFDRPSVGFSLPIGSSAPESLFRIGGEAVDLGAVRSIWTRGTAGHIGDVHAAENSLEARAIAEVRHAHAYLWQLLEGRRWVNPLAAFDRTNRLLQCREAHALGMRVAPSLVSTRGSDIARFVADHGQCIVKPIGQGRRGERGPGLVLVNRYPDDVVLEEDLPVPMLVQQFVDKDHELRVAVVNDRVFAAAIDTASTEASAVDSRNWVNTGLSHYRVALAPGEQEALVRLNARLGYVYSAMDLIRSPDGSLTFLEANPAGQWTFMEVQTGYAVSEAIVEELCR
jgi:glutathione synthase/RimK-type ligase-like ATP-grasp enzyme